MEKEKYIHIDFEDDGVVTEAKNINIDRGIMAIDCILNMLDNNTGISKKQALSALTRMYADSDEVDYEPYNARLCCVEAPSRTDFRVGSIYNVENGVLMGNTSAFGRNFGHRKPFKDLNDINNTMSPQFIEVEE